MKKYCYDNDGNLAGDGRAVTGTVKLLEFCVTEGAMRSGMVREAYRRKMLELVQKMSKVLDGAEPDRARRAWSIVAIMVGAISISRAMPDGEEANRAIDFALQTANVLIDG